jgi:uncharacterized protein (DUF1800 family)
MTIDPKMQAATLLHRFGFAPKAGGLAAFSRDPRAALLAELERPNAGAIVNDDLLTTGEAARQPLGLALLAKVEGRQECRGDAAGA